MSGVPAHTVRVKTAYRRLLKMYFDYFHTNRGLYLYRVRELRDEFEKYRHIEDVGESNYLITKAEEFALKYAHPEPYKPISSVNGGMWMRNEPFSLGSLKPKEYLDPHGSRIAPGDEDVPEGRSPEAGWQLNFIREHSKDPKNSLSNVTSEEAYGRGWGNPAGTKDFVPTMDAPIDEHDHKEGHSEKHNNHH